MPEIRKGRDKKKKVGTALMVLKTKTYHKITQGQIILLNKLN